MKEIDRKTVSRLEDLPNVGKKIAEKLRLIDINDPENLVGKDAFKLYYKLCEVSGKKYDLCLLDTFMSVIYFLETGKAFSWWEFTEKRKEILKDYEYNR